MKITKLNVMIMAGVVLGWNVALAGEAPKGWFPAGSHPKEYVMSLDHKITHGGKGSASLKSIVEDTRGFGTLMQAFKPDAFRGKRVRMSGYVKAKEVKDWAGLWMRVDESPGGQVLAFDNMQDRPIKGTTDWVKCEVVLDVPQESQGVSFGLLLTGEGQVWMDDLKFEVVGTDVPTTGGAGKESVPKAPTNLDFEE